MWMWLLGLAICTLPASAVAGSADFAFQQHLKRQVACNSDPDPTAVLLYLVKTKRIDLGAGNRVDSETCWPIKPKLAVEGMDFVSICASAEDPLLIDLFPKLYWRGPGTSPGTGLRLVTDPSVEAVREWAKRELGDGPYQVDAAYYEEGKTQISCNSLWRN